jgi:hypothetical protein
VDGEEEQQGETKEEEQGWLRRSCSLQGMDKAELQELVDGGRSRGWRRRSSSLANRDQNVLGGTRSHFIPQLRARQSLNVFPATPLSTRPRQNEFPPVPKSAKSMISTLPGRAPSSPTHASAPLSPPRRPWPLRSHLHP